MNNYHTANEINEINRIADKWKTNGTDIIGDAATSEIERRLPKHPEFVYRQSGEWTGWNNFLNVDESDPAFNENIAQDRIESLAFIIFHGGLS